MNWQFPLPTPSSPLATNASYDASETKVDAMIGADYLRYFDLYFDYPHGRFIVKPNERFYQMFSKNGSGTTP